jgi:hypothetical protein
MRVQRAQIFQLAASDGGLTTGPSGHTIGVALTFGRLSFLICRVPAAETTIAAGHPAATGVD